MFVTIVECIQSLTPFKQFLGNLGKCLMDMGTRVDPLTSILAVLARSCQILTTSWQPWIPWQDSY